jgi:hypothetical protein
MSPRSGMTLEENLADLRRQADDFTRAAGYTFTVLDPDDNDVIGCVYLYPSASEEWDVTVQSWVRADRSDLDVPLADAIARWLATDWPSEHVDHCGHRVVTARSCRGQVSATADVRVFVAAR